MGFPAYSHAALDLVPPEHLEPPPGDELRYLVRDVLRALAIAPVVPGTPPRPRSVTRDGGAGRRGRRLRFDSTPLGTGPGAADPCGAS